MSEVYPTPHDFCEARRFVVRRDEDGGCFDGALHLTSPGGRFIAKREKPPKVKNSGALALAAHPALLVAQALVVAAVAQAFLS